MQSAVKNLKKNTMETAVMASEEPHRNSTVRRAFKALYSMTTQRFALGLQRRERSLFPRSQ